MEADINGEMCSFDVCDFFKLFNHIIIKAFYSKKIQCAYIVQCTCSAK